MLELGVIYRLVFVSGTFTYFGLCWMATKSAQFRRLIEEWEKVPKDRPGQKKWLHFQILWAHEDHDEDHGELTFGTDFF